MGFNEEYMGVSLINYGSWVVKHGLILPNSLWIMTAHTHSREIYQQTKLRWDRNIGMRF